MRPAQQAVTSHGVQVLLQTICMEDSRQEVRNVAVASIGSRATGNLGHVGFHNVRDMQC